LSWNKPSKNWSPNIWRTTPVPPPSSTGCKCSAWRRKWRPSKKARQKC